MSQPDPPPTQTTWLQTVLENVKDMPPLLRFGIVFVALILFFLLSNATIPDSFDSLLPLIYFLAIGIALLYMVWEWQQFNFRKTSKEQELGNKKDVRGHQLETLKAKQKHERELKEIEDREKARKHQERLEKLKQTNPPSSEKKSDLNALQHNYLTWLMENSGKIYLSRIDPDPQTKIDAHLALQAVYTALLTTSPDEHQPQAHGRGEKQQSALEQVNRHPKLVLLGAPGSGKSTFVNFLALCLAGELLADADLNHQFLTRPLPQEDGTDQDTPQTWDQPNLFPVLVVLRDLAAHLPPAHQPATPTHLWEFLRGELAKSGVSEFCDELAKKFRAGQAILLLDGLDELNESQDDNRRKQICRLVEQLAATPKSRILVTSRIYAYKGEYQLTGFQEATLAPFSKGQIIRFIHNWYDHIATIRKDFEPAYREKRRDELIKAIFDSPDRLLKLAEQPLLLALMAILHAWRRKELPKQREELYAQTVQLLLEVWEEQRTLGKEEKKAASPAFEAWVQIELPLKQELLEELAFKAHENQGDANTTTRL